MNNDNDELNFIYTFLFNLIYIVFMISLHNQFNQISIPNGYPISEIKKLF